MTARYEPVELPPGEQGRVSWGIIDHQAHGPDKVVTDPDGGYELFYNREGALGWIGRQTYLDEVGIVSR